MITTVGIEKRNAFRGGFACAVQLMMDNPGKLSEKLVTGLGFLATLAGFRAINDIAFSDNKNNERTRGFATLGALTAIGIGIGAVTKNPGNTKSISKFLTKEAFLIYNLIMSIILLIYLTFIIGLICIGIFGLILGALIYLPVAVKNSPLPIEKLSADMIWRYVPDWLLFFIGCVIFILISFMLISGFLRY